MEKSMENMHTDVRVIKGKGLFSNLVLVDVLASEHRPIRRNNLSTAVIYSKKLNSNLITAGHVGCEINIPIASTKKKMAKTFLSLSQLSRSFTTLTYILVLVANIPFNHFLLGLCRLYLGWPLFHSKRDGSLEKRSFLQTGKKKLKRFGRTRTRFAITFVTLPF